MKTCDICKWWSAPKPYLCGQKNPKIYSSLFGSCDNPALDDSQGVVGRPVSEVEGDPSHACPNASDDHGICFATGPKFGCIHFELDSGTLQDIHETQPPRIGWDQ